MMSLNYSEKTLAPPISGRRKDTNNSLSISYVLQEKRATKSGDDLRIGNDQKKTIRLSQDMNAAAESI